LDAASAALPGEKEREKKMTVVKLDSKFYGEVRKVKDNSVVPDDEYIVFLAKDNAFCAILPNYLEECIRLGADQEQIDAVVRMMERAREWRAKHPERCKTPDARGERLLDLDNMQ
jgi:hypothetical protein